MRHNGRLDTKSIVDAARPAGAPLHPAFEWDDGKAAECWRREQASHIVRHIEVVLDRPEMEPKPTRAFVSVVREDDRSYTSVQHALADDGLRAQVVAQARSELEAWRKRYAELVEFAELFATIEAWAA